MKEFQINGYRKWRSFEKSNSNLKGEQCRPESALKMGRHGVVVAYSKDGMRTLTYCLPAGSVTLP